MSENRLITLQSLNGDMTKCKLVLATQEPWQIVFTGLGYVDTVFSGEDLFAAYKELWLALERVGFKLLCQGSRMDVIASGMSRAMGGGRKVYTIRFGFQARRRDLVGIFDPMHSIRLHGVSCLTLLGTARTMNCTNPP